MRGGYLVQDQGAQVARVDKFCEASGSGIKTLGECYFFSDRFLIALMIMNDLSGGLRPISCQVNMLATANNRSHVEQRGENLKITS